MDSSSFRTPFSCSALLASFSPSLSCSSAFFSSSFFFSASTMDWNLSFAISLMPLDCTGNFFMTFLKSSFVRTNMSQYVRATIEAVLLVSYSNAISPKNPPSFNVNTTLSSSDTTFNSPRLIKNISLPTSPLRTMNEFGRQTRGFRHFTISLMKSVSSLHCWNSGTFLIISEFRITLIFVFRYGGRSSSTLFLSSPLPDFHKYV
mmetsp:Transcript_40608/g.67890  ORF Transcript_40608/g.67890 Transcript_40608/m.67890 type:complete len:204 (-) Transcript_40608:46-657(-)